MGEATEKTAEKELAEFIEGLREVKAFRYGKFSSKRKLANGYTIRFTITAGKEEPR